MECKRANTSHVVFMKKIVWSVLITEGKKYRLKGTWSKKDYSLWAQLGIS